MDDYRTDEVVCRNYPQDGNIELRFIAYGQWRNQDGTKRASAAPSILAQSPKTYKPKYKRPKVFGFDL